MSLKTPGTMKRFALASLAVIGLGGAAHAEDVYCPPDLGAVTIDGNVLITAACRMEGTTVEGNILLYAGGSLVARGLDVDGNVQGEDADYVDIMESSIDGSVQLERLVGDASNLTSNLVNGNIQLDDNRTRLEVLDNTVGGDIQAFDNSGGVVIADNVVDGNLQCKANAPAPVGSNNRVSGNMEDQCADLHPQADSGSGNSGGTDGGSGSGDGGSGDGGSGGGNGGSGGGVIGGASEGTPGSSGGGSFDPVTLGGFLGLFIATAALRRQRHSPVALGKAQSR